MALYCTSHHAFLYDRGGKQVLGSLGPLTSVRWERIRDDVSTAQVDIAERNHECNTTLGLAAAGRSELVIYRGDQRVWEGPITHITYQGQSVSISAKDVVHYISRTVLTQEYNNSYPNIVKVMDRMATILGTELVRMEAQDPPINLLPYLVVHADPGAAGTSAHTLPYEMSVFEHMDQLAARGGLDYTVVGRALHLWDVHQPSMGRLPGVTKDDFLGDVVITEYGMELATVSVITDGRGRAGIAGQADPYYGLVEVIDTAYDESTGDQWDDPDSGWVQPEPPSLAEMASQASRVLAGRNPTPVVVRVPDGSSLNPNGVLAIQDLVPGVHIPLTADLPGRSLSQVQKLDRVTVEEGSKGEEIKVTLSPSPVPGSNEEDI